MFKKAALLLFAVCSATWVTGQDYDQLDGGDPLDGLRAAIPGEPGVDYPIYVDIADTSFSCTDRIFGGRHTSIQL